MPNEEKLTIDQAFDLLVLKVLSIRHYELSDRLRYVDSTKQMGLYNAEIHNFEFKYYNPIFKYVYEIKPYGGEGFTFLYRVVNESEYTLNNNANESSYLFTYAIIQQILSIARSSYDNLKDTVKDLLIIYFIVKSTYELHKNLSYSIWRQKLIEYMIDKASNSSNTKLSNNTDFADSVKLPFQNKHVFDEAKAYFAQEKKDNPSLRTLINSVKEQVRSKFAGIAEQSGDPTFLAAFDIKSKYVEPSLEAELRIHFKIFHRDLYRLVNSSAHSNSIISILLGNSLLPRDVKLFANGFKTGQIKSNEDIDNFASTLTIPPL